MILGRALLSACIVLAPVALSAQEGAAPAAPSPLDDARAAFRSADYSKAAEAVDISEEESYRTSG